MKRTKYNTYAIFLACLLTLLLFGVLSACKKLIEIPEPTNKVVATDVFLNDDQAIAAVAGIYFKMINGINPAIFRGGLTVYGGLCSDEVKLFNLSNLNITQFQNNSIISNNTNLRNEIWSQAFTYIYAANAAIENLRIATGVSSLIKKELEGEAKFIRAFSNFYLVNLFGDIPIVTTINWRNTNLVRRSSINQVFDFILSDLSDALGNLSSDFAFGNGERIVPTKWSVLALLSRVHLYRGNWEKAKEYSTQIISNNLFALSSSPNDVFQKNSLETIWQLKQDNSIFSLNATPEGRIIVPRSGSAPYLYLTGELLSSFENNDLRKTYWLNSHQFGGNTYYYPCKYKVGQAQASVNGTYTEYYMVFRLSEQYLIRAEARANQNNLPEAIADINIIRQRAGLSVLPNTLNQQQVLDAVEKERRIELFAEWGHRWLDLKRWGKADAVLGPIKGTNWQTTDQLYPIPQSELQTNPNLTQNPGY